MRTITFELEDGSEVVVFVYDDNHATCAQRPTTDHGDVLGPEIAPSYDSDHVGVSR